MDLRVDEPVSRVKVLTINEHSMPPCLVMKNIFLIIALPSLDGRNFNLRNRVG
jgi:hypothetical protein